MKSVLISIRPKRVDKIASGEKTIEVRKTAPKCEVPFKCYIYCTFPKKPVYTLWLNRGTENKFLADGKVIGEFVCDKVDEIIPDYNGDKSELEVTVEVAKDTYKVNYIYLTEYTLYFIEDISGAHVDPYHYEIHYIPEMIQIFTITTSK